MSGFAGHRVRQTVRETGLTLITLGVVVLAFVAYQLFGTTFSEQHSQSVLSKQFSAAPSTSPGRASTSASTGASTGTSTRVPAAAPPTSAGGLPSGSSSEVLPSVPTGHAIDHLAIPAIGVDKFVVEGTAEADLAEGPGHYVGTALPGQIGNVGIAGHRTTFGAPFFRLGELKVGDPIYITDLAGHTWLYKVSTAPQIVSPTDVAVLDPTPFAQLTLTTCNPIFSATSRLVVFARLVGKAVSIAVEKSPPITALASGSSPSASSSTRSVPTAVGGGASAATGAGGGGKVAGFNSRGGTSKAWFPALSYGLAAVLLWLSTRVLMAATRRWRRLAVFAGGVAACAVPLWFCFENATRLQPPGV